MNRRGFLGRSLAAGSLVAWPCLIPARALGRDGAVAPSERIVLAGIGLGPRGQYDLSVMLPEKDMQFVAICDAARGRREQVKQTVDAHYGNKDCRLYRDMFELLARPDIDAVLIATGDHWHALASLLAAKAGKDVYSEKPCGMTIGEIQSLADGIHRYGRVFQAGTQRRSVSNFQYAVHLAQSGKLGRLHTLHASVYVPSKNYAWLPAEPEPPKEECDWDLWLGPAPWRPYNSRYVSGGWRGHHDFEAGGNFLDWGAHTVDLCQWANQADHTTPLEFEATPNSIVARYANGVKLVCDFLPTAFGNRDPQYHTSTGTCPVRFEGDEGWVETGRQLAARVLGEPRQDPEQAVRRHRAQLGGAWPELLRLRQVPGLAGLQPGHHAPLASRLFRRPALLAIGPQAHLRSGQGGVRRRRGSQPHASARHPGTVELQHLSALAPSTTRKPQLMPTRYSLLVLTAACLLAANTPAADTNADKTRKLVAVLQSNAPLFDKARACQQLGEFGGREAVPALAALLADEHLSAYARSGLEGIPDPSAAEALRSAAATLKGNRLAGVVNSLGVLRDAQAVGLLRKLADDPALGRGPGSPAGPGAHRDRRIHRHPPPSPGQWAGNNPRRGCDRLPSRRRKRTGRRSCRQGRGIV